MRLRNLRGGRIPAQERVPRIAELVIDPLGYLWVKPYELPDDSILLVEKHALWTAPGGEWIVLRRDGTRVATVRMPGDVTPPRIAEDRILGLSRDELGVERVVVHELRR